MTAAHFHIIINHFPFAALVVALLAAAHGMFWRQDSVKKFSLYLLVFTALTAFVANYTGDLSEESIEDLPGVSESMIHQHEQAAETAAKTLSLVAALAAGILFARRGKSDVSNSQMGIVLAASLLALAFVAKTNNLGGQIRRPELRTTSASEGSATTSPTTQDSDGDEHNSDDPAGVSGGN